MIPVQCAAVVVVDPDGQWSIRCKLLADRGSAFCYKHRERP